MAQLGDVQVLARDAGTEIYVTLRGRAEIWTEGGWAELRAMVSVSGDPKRVQVRVSAADLTGLPYPTGNVTVVSNIAGWQGAVAVS
jgi:hypothetical protein